ncbi:MAG: homocysteine biosynthesis protein [Candidatus Latescibacteria bacterium]|nr:homocysteine biosynthesis protein [Candidatus Latescibacterota bacterium]
MAKSYAEINAKIKKGAAVVVTAEEIIDIVEQEGPRRAAEQVDVVTTGTFGPMCSSGVLLNIGHSTPKIKIHQAWLNDIPISAGLAAVDLYLGATALPEHDPLNTHYPGEFLYGGGHVIQDLVGGKDIQLKAIGYGTDCYPRKRLETWINIKDLNEATLLNPRNAYQNYNVAVNLSAKTIHTYMGVLKSNLGNAIYCSAGQLSPLFNDPFYRTIGVGSRIFLGGGVGYVCWHGTQHDPNVPRGENGVVKAGAGTLAVIGDLKQMSPEWLVGVSMLGYGASLTVGLGIPIPILNEQIVRFTAVKDEEIWAPIVDYSDAYPNNRSEILGEVDYKSLKQGNITIKGRKVPTSSLSSYSKAREIAKTLKEWIKKGEFLLGAPSQLVPSVESGIPFKPLKYRPIQ